MPSTAKNRRQLYWLALRADRAGDYRTVEHGGVADGSVSLADCAIQSRASEHGGSDFSVSSADSATPK